MQQHKLFTELSRVGASLALAPELLDVEEVLPPGGRAPHGVGVHDAQVLALLDGAAGTSCDLRESNRKLSKQTMAMKGCGDGAKGKHAVLKTLEVSVLKLVDRNCPLLIHSVKASPLQNQRS